MLEFIISAQFLTSPQSRLSVKTGDSQSTMVWSLVSTKHIENIHWLG